jgi:hypothetical protein
MLLYRSRPVNAQWRTNFVRTGIDVAGKSWSPSRFDIQPIRRQFPALEQGTVCVDNAGGSWSIRVRLSREWPHYPNAYLEWKKGGWPVVSRILCSISSLLKRAARYKELLKCARTKFHMCFREWIWSEVTRTRKLAKAQTEPKSGDHSW